jgi:multisubunit Na+/H+ antiporter MnhB subunit
MARELNAHVEIVRTIANVIFPFALVFGIYVILHGHLTPGGGFQGGAATASAIAMMLCSIRLDRNFQENKRAQAYHYLKAPRTYFRRVYCGNRAFQDVLL